MPDESNTSTAATYILYMIYSSNSKGLKPKLYIENGISYLLVDEMVEVLRSNKGVIFLLFEETLDLYLRGG